MSRKATAGLILAATATLPILTACSSTTPEPRHITTISLGAGDHLGERLRANHLLITGREAWDRDEVIAQEATRLAEAVRIMREQDAEDLGYQRPSVIVNEPIPID